jgi:hypothetical protein
MGGTMPSKKKKPTPSLTAEVAMKMTPTVGAPPSEVKGIRRAKAAPDELAEIKGRSAKARFTGSVLKDSEAKESLRKNRRPRTRA